MAYAEKRGKGSRPWRVKYKIPGGEDSKSGFETKKAALSWGRDQEAKVRTGTWTDPGGRRDHSQRMARPVEGAARCGPAHH
jgi:hypothetical protein